MCYIGEEKKGNKYFFEIVHTYDCKCGKHELKQLDTELKKEITQESLRIKEL